MLPTLIIRLLGRFEVERDGAPIPPPEWRGQKTRDLLKILILAGGKYVSKDQLCDWLWPEADPDSAQTNLRALVSDLRKVLEPDLARGRDSTFILTRHEGYAFNPDASLALDLTEFERAASATSRLEIESVLALYRGDLLEEDPYAEWAARERERLRELRLDLLARLSELLLQDHAYAQCAAVCEQALALDLSRESIWRILMRAHSLNHDRAAALNTFDRCRAALSRDLGVDPAPETVGLHEQILRDELASDLTGLRAKPPDRADLKDRRGLDHRWLYRLGAVGFTLWAVITGINFALSLAGLFQGSLVSPGDPGSIALPYLLNHPESLDDLNQSLYWRFPLGWLLLPGYVAWFLALRSEKHSSALLWIGLSAGVVDALTQTLSGAIGLTQLSVLPSAYLSAPVDQRLSLVALWEVLRQLASISGIIGLIANPIGLGLLLLASRGHPKFPAAIVWPGLAIVAFSILYYLLPPGPASFLIGSTLAFGLRAWLAGLAAGMWRM